MKHAQLELVTLRKALSAAGARMTPQRVEVYIEVAQAVDHPSVAEIHERVRKRLPQISLDTVYRTLRTLTELGLVRQLTSSGERNRFDSTAQPHHHFVCVKCGRTIDFESESLDRVKIPEEGNRIGDVWGMHMEVRGLCSDCAESRSVRMKDEERGDGS